MKVLFLDVDGVLNAYGEHEMLNPYRCRLLRKVIETTGAEIVISSTWRKSREALHRLWAALGMDMKAKWAGCTPILDSRHESGIILAKVRGDEIQAWLDKHPEVTRFAIVDDDCDMAHLTPHLVRTNGRAGLTDEDADNLVANLNLP